MRRIKNNFILVLGISLIVIAGCTAKNIAQVTPDPMPSPEVKATPIVKNENIVNSTAIVLNNTSVKEQESDMANEICQIYKGNLIKILKHDADKWYYVQLVCLSYPPVEGYINKDDVVFDKEKSIPNQGFVSGKNVYTQPNSDSKIFRNNYNGPVDKIVRRNGWICCSLIGGADDVWVKEFDVEYLFPEQP